MCVGGGGRGGTERDKGEEARLTCGEAGQELSPCLTRGEVMGDVVTFSRKTQRKELGKGKGDARTSKNPWLDSIS